MMTTGSKKVSWMITNRPLWANWPLCPCCAIQKRVPSIRTRSRTPIQLSIGFHGTVRHVGEGKQVPEYQLHLGGGFDADGVQFGRHIVKIPAQRAGEALLRLLDLYRDEREPGEDARAFFRRVTKEEVVEALGDTVLDSRFTNLRDAPMVTSCRKFDRFGDWHMFAMALQLREIRAVVRGRDTAWVDRYFFDFNDD